MHQVLGRLPRDEIIEMAAIDIDTLLKTCLFSDESMLFCP